MDGMIVLPHAHNPHDMILLAGITRRPICGEHYRCGIARAAAYRRHDCGIELVHIRQPPGHGLIGSIVLSRERSVLAQMPGSLSVGFGTQPPSFLRPALGALARAISTEYPKCYDMEVDQPKTQVRSFEVSTYCI